MWARIDLIDPGTAGMVREGMKILLDREGLLSALAARLEEAPRRQ